MKKKLIAIVLAITLICSIGYMGCQRADSPITNSSECSSKNISSKLSESDSSSNSSIIEPSSSMVSSEKIPGSSSTPASSTSPVSSNTSSKPSSNLTASSKLSETKPIHTHSYIKKVVVATCTEEGYTIYTCSCGDNYKDGQTTALGHSYGKWTVTKEATTITEGNRTRTCSRCGAKETQTVPMKVESENQPKIDPALRQSDIYKAVTLLNPDTDFTNPNKGGKIVYDDSWGCWDGFTDNGNYKTATRMCCASFVNFYLWNYLPNIAGKSSGVTWKTDPDRSGMDLHTQRIGASSVWYSLSQALNWRCTYDANPNLQMGLDYSFVPKDYKAGKIKYHIGDIIVFSNSQYRYSHVAVYAGYYNGQHWIAHCTANYGGGVMLTPFNGYSIVDVHGSLIYPSKIYTQG